MFCFATTLLIRKATSHALLNPRSVTYMECTTKRYLPDGEAASFMRMLHTPDIHQVIQQVLHGLPLLGCSRGRILGGIAACNNASWAGATCKALPRSEIPLNQDNSTMGVYVLLLLQFRTQPHLGCCLAAAVAAASAIFMHLCTNSATP
jgi:hypothetical protein